MESDHKPVVAYYIMETKKINHEKLEEIKKQFFYVSFLEFLKNIRFWVSRKELMHKILPKSNRINQMNTPSHLFWK